MFLYSQGMFRRSPMDTETTNTGNLHLCSPPHTKLCLEITLMDMWGADPQIIETTDKGSVDLPV